MKEGKLLTVATDYEQPTMIASDILTKEEVEEKERNIDKKIQKINKKIDSKSAKIKALEAKVKELEDSKWKYRIGEEVLYKGWRIAKITDYLERKTTGCDYRVEFFDAYGHEIKNCYGEPVWGFAKESDLSAYCWGEYKGRLFDKILQLEEELDRYKRGY